MSIHLGRLVPQAEAIAIARDLDKMIDDAGSEKPEAKAGVAAPNALCAPGMRHAAAERFGAFFPARMAAAPICHPPRHQTVLP